MWNVSGCDPWQSAQFAPHGGTLGRLLIEPHSADQVLKTWIVAHGIKERMHFEKLQNAGLLLVGAFKPHKCLLVVAKGQMWIDQGAGWNV